MASIQLGMACVALLAVASVPAASAIGGWQRVEMTPLLQPHHRMRPEEQLKHAHMRLRDSSATAGAWLMAKKEKILTEEEIYAEKVRKFARSVDQVSAPTSQCFLFAIWVFFPCPPGPARRRAGRGDGYFGALLP